MAVKIRLKRLGKIRVPQYRIVVVDSRKKRDGRVIEEIGTYQPKSDPSVISVESERAQYWLGVGAQPTDTVQSLLAITGDWQKFKGLPGTEGRLKSPAEKRSKLDIFNEALKEAGSDSVGGEKSDDADDKADKPAKPAKKATKKAADKTPGDETPEGATEQAEVEETKALDDERQQEPEDAAKDGSASS